MSEKKFVSEVKIMIKSIKVLASAVLVSSVILSSVGCTKQNLSDKVTESNLNSVVSDYTQIYNYYEKLRVALVDIDKIKQSGEGETNLKKLQSEVETNLEKVKKLDYDYINLYEAREYLEDCYKDVKKASEKALSDEKNYNSSIVDFKEDFAEFKQSMALARKDISSIRGGSMETEDTQVPVTNEETTDENSSGALDNVIDSAKDRIESAALSDDLKKAIEENAYLSGQEYRANGGTEADAEKKAKEMFAELENDNPIDASQKSAAESAYVSAFKKGFDEYKK